MGEAGYIKLWRKMWSNPSLRKRPNHLSVWLWLLTNAAWNEETQVRFRNEVIILRKGQVTCGAHQIAEETGVAPSTVARVINCFENEKLIEKQTDNRCSLITVLNWEQYQGDEKQNEKQMRSKREADEKQMRTNKEDKNIRTKEDKNTITVPSERTEIVDEEEIEFRRFIPIASDVLRHEKTFSKEALTKWKARRKKFSALEITEAFKNLVNECDLWKIENNGFRPLSWWLHSDKRIEDMQVVHLKQPARGKNTGFVIS